MGYYAKVSYKDYSAVTYRMQGWCLGEVHLMLKCVTLRDLSKTGCWRGIIRVTHLGGIEAIQLIVNRGERCTPIGVPAF